MLKIPYTRRHKHTYKQRCYAINCPNFSLFSWLGKLNVLGDIMGFVGGCVFDFPFLAKFKQVPEGLRTSHKLDMVLR